MTLLFALVMIAYGGKRFIVFINRDDTNFQEAESVKQLGLDDEPATLGELDFNLNFRLVKTEGLLMKSLDKSDYKRYLSVEVV